MMSSLLAKTVPAPQAVADLELTVDAVCRAIAPLWGLRDMVAVNPYVGHAGLDLLQAEDVMQRRHHAAVLPGWQALRQAWHTQAFTAAHLSASRSANAPPVEFTVARLDGHGGDAPPSRRCLSIAGVLDARDGSDWVAAVVETLGRFLAARSDRGVGRWALPAGDRLWADWRTWMRHDRSLAVRGLRGVNAWIAGLPEDPATARRSLLDRLNLAGPDVPDYLGRLLGEIPGWAGWLRQEAWHATPESCSGLPDLLSMRLALDLALRERHPAGGVGPAVPPPGVPAALAQDRAARLAAVAAWEHAVRSKLLREVRPVGNTHCVRPAAQAVFCIDVRSEGLRRHLEAADAEIETYGFAGFFAMSVTIAGENRAQCPVILQAGTQIGLAPSPSADASRLLGSFRRSPGGGFAYMETAGPTAALHLAAGSLGRTRHVHRDESAALDADGIPADVRLAMLRGMLANLGLSRPFARVVLLCGHDSTVANNPQAAGLACGACGGHSGAVNARLAAALYNDPALRRMLGDNSPPEDSVAVAAVHDTATDMVRILDSGRIPASHAADLQRLSRALDAAGAGQRARRAPALPGMQAGRSLLDRLLARSRDWAELRPEWGLANCAAFIAAPRAMTAGADLGGRCFLHSYDAALDPDGAVLTLILTAPVVVASWINLQYWASSVDPGRLGSGNKAVHTVVGGIGVAAGAGGDLLPGLAWQSVHDGAAFRHEPIRLQVMVAAERQRIDAVIAGHAHLRDLVQHGWIALHSLDPATGACRRRLADGTWEMVQP